MLSIFLIILLVFMSAPMVNADGWHPSAEYLHLYEPAQKAVIYWGGTTEIMVLSSAVKSDNLTDIAWIVPIISTAKPVVSAGNMSVFEKLVDFFGVTAWWENPFRKLGGYDGGNNITIIETYEVDIYDVIILKTSDASDLLDWLVENNLMFPEKAHDVIDRYVSMDNCYFVINKIDLKNRFKDVIQQLENGTVPERIDEYKQVLRDLRMGMATPLEFEFTPPEPYYPLVISSLNAGEGKIEVYVISEKPVFDVNGIMQVDKIKNMTKDLKEKLQDFFPIENEEYVTRLSFNGLLNDLTDDAVFDFFKASNRYDSVFLCIPSNLENLTGIAPIDVMVYDQKGGLIELQYRLNKDSEWMVAQRADMKYMYARWWDIYEYSVPVYKTEGALWTIVLDTEKITTENNTLELRILHKRYNHFYYTPIYSYDFSILDDSETEESSLENNSFYAALISGLVIISIFSVAVISKKTKIS